MRIRLNEDELEHLLTIYERTKEGIEPWHHSSPDALWRFRQAGYMRKTTSAPNGSGLYQFRFTYAGYRLCASVLLDRALLRGKRRRSVR